jgi:hypothetical protein
MKKLNVVVASVACALVLMASNAFALGTNLVTMDATAVSDDLIATAQPWFTALITVTVLMAGFAIVKKMISRFGK